MELFAVNNLELVVKYIKDGKVISLPSETTYGLSCDATNLDAVNAIFKIKGRDKKKPLLIVVPTIEMAKKYLEWNDLVDQLATKYWPGPLTIVSKIKKCKLVAGVCSAENTLALRISSHPILNKVSLLLGRPIVSTSANVSNGGNLYDPNEVVELFSKRKERPDYILDYGRLEKNKPSTLVSVLNGKIDILRQGELQVTL